MKQKQKLKKNPPDNFIIFAVVFIFLAGFIVRGLFINPPSIVPVKNKTIRITQIISQIITQGPKPKNILLPNPVDGKYKVIKVTDGDTITLETDEGLRLDGIDASELNKR